MPAGQHAISQIGEMNEQFAGLIIGELAFVTRVPRPMDVGHDLVCVMKEEDKVNPEYLKAGPSFRVQVKSNHDNLLYRNEREVQWLIEQEIPYFVCVVDRERLSIDLYSTWNVHNSYLWCNSGKLTLKLGEDIDPMRPTYPRDKPKCREKQFIPLGKPILSIGVSEIWESEKIAQYRSVLRDWVLLEQENIVNIRAKMHWVVGPTVYETNEIPPQAQSLFVYYNLGQNFEAYVRNLGRTTTLLRSAYFSGLEGLEYERLAEPRCVETLDDLIVAYWSHFDPQIRQVLEQLQADLKQISTTCKGITRKGARCKNPALQGQEFCRQHIPEVEMTP